MQCKIINKRERYGLTWLGRIVFLFAAILSVIICFHFIYPFLALNAPVNGDIMVVEGWLPDYVLQEPIRDFQEGSYKLLVTTGGSLPQNSYFAGSGYSTLAELTAARLKKLDLMLINLLQFQHQMYIVIELMPLPLS